MKKEDAYEYVWDERYYREDVSPHNVADDEDWDTHARHQNRLSCPRIQ
jgi:hypothetical protein